MTENKENIKAENNKNSEETTADIKKQPKRKGIFKKFLVICVLGLAIAPLTYFDFDTLMAKFSDLSKMITKYTSQEEITIDNSQEDIIAQIKERENIAQQIIIETIDEPVLNDDITLDETPVEDNIVEPEAPVVNSAELETLNNRLDTIESEVSVINRERANQGMAFVLMQMKMQIDAGVPYEKELAILEAIVASKEESLANLAVLQSYAKTGIPTQIELAREFKKITTPEKIGVIIPEETSWSDRFLIKVRSLVSIRKTENTDDKSLMDAIDAARNAIYENDFAEAVNILLPFKDKVAKPMADWINNASMRIEATKIINSLMSDAVVLFTAERLM